MYKILYLLVLNFLTNNSSILSSNYGKKNLANLIAEI